MTDPGFSRGGNLLCGKGFAENWMKMNGMGLRRGCVGGGDGTPHGSTTASRLLKKANLLYIKRNDI